MAEAACAFCGKALRLDRVGFRDTCSHCGRALHACVQCAHYAPGKPHDCNEPNIEPVRDKDRENRCDWYRFGARTGAASLSRVGAEQMLKDLFKK